MAEAYNIIFSEKESTTKKTHVRDGTNKTKTVKLVGKIGEEEGAITFELTVKGIPVHVSSSLAQMGFQGEGDLLQGAFTPALQQGRLFDDEDEDEDEKSITG